MYWCGQGTTHKYGQGEDVVQRAKPDEKRKPSKSAPDMSSFPIILWRMGEFVIRVRIGAPAVQMDPNNKKA
jgi:hypothetical protein